MSKCFKGNDGIIQYFIKCIVIIYKEAVFVCTDYTLCFKLGYDFILSVHKINDGF